jgi:dihydroceramidase
MSCGPVCFWGTPTSTVDWCEVNYAVTPYVCEFFNSLSSLAMVAAGTLGIFFHRRVFDAGTLSAFGLLSLVGIGSIAFHGTLKFELQLLDEIPMLYLVTLMAYLLIEPGPARRFGWWLPSALAFYAFVATISDAFTAGQVQFFGFQISFGALEFFCLGRVYLLSRDPENVAIRPLFRLGVASYLGAICLWFVDLRFCDIMNHRLQALGLPNPQLHAWWHILVSCGFYLLLVVVGYDRLRRRGRGPTVRRLAGIIPTVVLAA